MRKSSLWDRVARRSSNASRFHTEKETPPPLILLASQASAFSDYIDACPPNLKELGLFREIFEKWPTDPALQKAAA